MLFSILKKSIEPLFERESYRKLKYISICKWSCFADVEMRTQSPRHWALPFFSGSPSVVLMWVTGDHKSKGFEKYHPCNIYLSNAIIIVAIVIIAFRLHSRRRQNNLQEGKWDNMCFPRRAFTNSVSVMEVLNLEVGPCCWSTLSVLSLNWLVSLSCLLRIA